MESLHSTPESFFREAEPTTHCSGSPISCSIGCYTSMAGLKQKYRQLEELEEFLI